MKAKPDHIISSRLLPVADTSDVVSVAKRAGPKLRIHPHSTQITEDWRKSRKLDYGRWVAMVGANIMQLRWQKMAECVVRISKSLYLQRRGSGRRLPGCLNSSEGMLSQRGRAGHPMICSSCTYPYGALPLHRQVYRFGRSLDTDTTQSPPRIAMSSSQPFPFLAAPQTSTQHLNRA